jgi:NRPS condensation-like uncharacterized protein
LVNFKHVKNFSENLRLMQELNSHPGKEFGWYKLDTSANVYPASQSKKQPHLFRLSCTLKEPINPEILQAALQVTIVRYPMFNVRLKRGVFWFYFETNTKVPIATEEVGHPCQGIDPMKTGEFLFRVVWYRNRIAMEIFHVISDANGGIEFMKTLVYYYLLLAGKAVQPEDKILTLAEGPFKEECENSFETYYDPDKVGDRAEESAFHLSGTYLPFDTMRVIQGVIPADHLLAHTRSLGGTITEFLTTTMLIAYYEALPKMQNSTARVKVSVPINLRRLFPSRTLRNFVFYTNVGAPFRELAGDFTKTLALVKDHMRTEVTAEKVLPKMNPNYKSEKDPLLRMAPLDIKQVVLKMAHRIMGDDFFSCSLSNLGVIKLPASMEPFVERFDFILSVSDRVCINCAVCSYQNNLVVSISSGIQERDIERSFFRIMTRQGIPVVIQSTDN